MIKVTHIITGLSTGGAEMMLYKLLSSTDRDRFEPVVISLMNRGTLGARIEALGIPVYEMNMSPGRPTPVAMWRLIRLVRQLRPALIQGWMYHGNLAAFLAGRMVARHVPVLWNIRHTPYELKAEKRITAIVIRLGALLSAHAERIIYNSQFSMKQHQLLGYDASKKEIIPNGFDCNTFKPSEQARLKLRRELGLEENTLLIGLAARFHPMKDHGNFLRAARMLGKRRLDVHFVLAGRGIEENNQALAEEIRSMGIGDRVHLLGERSDIPDITAALDIASSSSWAEAFPNVIGEAMACGVPCVVTDVGDSAWIVGDTGVVVPPREPEALAKGWEKLINSGYEGRTRLGKEARRRIQENFSLPQVVARYEGLYEKVLSGKDRRIFLQR